MTLQNRKHRHKIGRPTIRKNGIAFTPAELSKRYRKRQKAKRPPPNCEWYTPTWFCQAVRRVFGGTIDLDPASCELANTVVKARHYFTIEDDGLSKAWPGRIFLNPPYNQGVLVRFIDKLLDEIAAGHCAEAILITRASTDTLWFKKLAASGATICFPKRVHFWSHSEAKKGDEWNTMASSATFYFGPHAKKFRAVFKKHGIVLTQLLVGS